jgi:hypothetical protein
LSKREEPGADLSACPSPERASVLSDRGCYQGSCGYGHYHDLLSPIVVRVAVAHPGGMVPNDGRRFDAFLPRARSMAFLN